MRRMYFGALLALLVVAPGAAAQSDTFRWGQVPQEHLDMREFPDDPDAQAVILRDVAHVEVDRTGTVEYRRHRRVKLLAEGGYDLATVTFVFDTTDRAQTVDNVRGHTLVPQPGGGVRRVALERNSIFTENLQGGRRRITFTLPALEPGAVIEYSYRFINASPLLIPRWYFQEAEPVLWSEYNLVHPRTLAYTFVNLNAPSFSVQTNDRGVRSNSEVTVRRWVTENVPALREEPFMTTAESHLQRLDGQLVEYLNPRVGAVRVLQTWNDLADTLTDHPEFGRALNLPRSLRRQVEEVVAGLDEPEARARAVYDYVRTTMAWDGRRGVFAERPLARALETRRGTAPEINLLLVALLREAGLSVEPALISTRDHGTVIELFPIVSQFNLTVAALRVGDGWTLLDATDLERPFGMLPADALNERAWVASFQPAWVPVASAPSVHRVHLTGEVGADGALVGTLRSERSGYAALSARHAVREHGASGYVERALLDGVAGLRVSGARVEEDGLEGPVVALAEIHLDAYLQAAGGLAMLPVKPFFREDENPFKRAERSFPVDFGYPRTAEFTAEIRLPEGHAVDESPGRSFFVLPHSGGVYERRLEVRDGVMHVSVRRALLRAQMPPEQYAAVRSFFEQVATAERDVLVLRRAEPDATATPASDSE